MTEFEVIKKIVAPFLVHGVCGSEAEAVRQHAQDFAQRQVRKYADRIEHFRSYYQTSVAQFAQQVAALCEGHGQIAALHHLEKQRADDASGRRSRRMASR
jgi:hypothetical protein